MKKSIAAVLLILFAHLLLLPTTPSLALSCVVRSGEDAYERFDGAVVAQVERVHLNSRYNQVDLTIMQSFKGVKQEKLTIDVDVSWGERIPGGSEGERYLIYLMQDEDGGWKLPLCVPYMKLDQASEELEFLKGKEIALESSGKFNGSPGWASWLVAILLFAVLLAVVALAYRRRRAKD